MTQWVDRAGGGRARGPRGLVRAWVEVLVRPRRFFRNGVAPGDQAPGLTFAVAVTATFVATRLAVAPEAVPRIDGPYVSAAVVLAAACLLVAPVALHLVAAIQTLLVVPLVRNRAGVSETVQVVGYATAPCAVAGLPWPPLQLAATGYGAVLLVVGLTVVHRTSRLRAVLAGAIPALLVFGLAFGGMAALAGTTGIDLAGPRIR